MKCDHVSAVDFYKREMTDPETDFEPEMVRLVSEVHTVLVRLEEHVVTLFPDTIGKAKAVKDFEASRLQPVCLTIEHLGTRLSMIRVLMPQPSGPCRSH